MFPTSRCIPHVAGYANIKTLHVSLHSWRKSTPRIASTPDRRNENIKYFIYLNENIKYDDIRIFNTKIKILNISFHRVGIE